MKFPQAIRAGDLIAQKLIGPSEAQPLLGRVDSVQRAEDGTISLRIRIWSLLPWGGRTVDVPADKVAWLGPQVALTGLEPKQLDALPTAGAARPVPPGETIRIAVVRPFH